MFWDSEDCLTEYWKRPARKIELPERQKSGESTLNRRYRRLSRARMSNVYVLIGVLIGIAVFYLLIVPVKDKNRKRDISKMEASYSEKLASKNAEADNLIREKDALQSEIDSYKENETKLNDDITGLEKKIKDLQALVAEYKDKLPDENTEETTEEGDSTEEGDTESTEETQNEKYDVDGISDTDVDNMIDNE